ncbi:hypothetical protein FPQ18DRAFT_353193 [Pyronema domesticum]|uniref:Phenylalanine--tRNA ligase, mitochondrial n=1 Tax=Pyronema omphalodes (strain CBS 100304) TaxID=1076935 RepID=U4LAC0_PYROM|nr:hypothetical protein FPQ18DRAFT_353193 [Pyronema domesticum]CCX07104.1 Similar to Phenylalanine--tRNA ligase, mitochondrial; acc. no. P08425 [Pyronema omphalodes CBS 100304]
MSTTTLLRALRPSTGSTSILRIRQIPRYYSSKITVGGKEYPTDEYTNLPPHIEACVGRNLHLSPNHPISITRRLIERRFPAPVYKAHNTLSPIVSVQQNFDSLGFPLDHPGRSRTDTYYINEKTVMRTHTSAHQADTFAAGESEGFTIAADVYRRDAIDRSHYPVFHQMEGARMWSRSEVPNGDIAAAVRADLEKLPKHDLVVEDSGPIFHEGNPLQKAHSAEECEAIAAHLKRSLEGVVVEVFGQAKKAAIAAGEAKEDDAPLRVRWIEAYFPFTTPSWELEVLWQGEWLELLGCGVVQQSIPDNAGTPDKVGWAFGVGLERVAMLLFGIPDIRLFWSKDERFLTQFAEGRITKFQSFSKYPPCYKDVAFWLPSSSSSAGGQVAFHENDMMETVRGVAGDLAEDVRLTDEFTHPKSGKKSMCFRINYRSLEKTLTNEETNALHEAVRTALKEKYAVELR